MKKNFLFALLSCVLPFLTHAICQRPNRKHENKEISHCPYLQENIYKAYAEKPGAYGDLEKFKKCFFCECPITEHTIEAENDVKKPVKKKEKRVIDNSHTHG